MTDSHEQQLNQRVGAWDRFELNMFVNAQSPLAITNLHLR